MTLICILGKMSQFPRNFLKIMFEKEFHCELSDIALYLIVSNSAGGGKGTIALFCFEN